MVGDVFISKGALTYKQVQCHLQGGGGVGAVKTIILKYPNSLLACFSSFFSHNKYITYSLWREQKTKLNLFVKSLTTGN